MWLKCMLFLAILSYRLNKMDGNNDGMPCEKQWCK
ncbi:excalibur calcium-binding domain-containing protein [Dechloromonas sp. TW-R-39-2]